MRFILVEARVLIKTFFNLSWLSYYNMSRIAFLLYCKNPYLLTMNCILGFYSISQKCIHHLAKYLWSKGSITDFQQSPNLNSCLLTRCFIIEINTVWKVSVLRVFLVRIFLHSDWIWTDTKNLLRYNTFLFNIPTFLSLHCFTEKI